MRHELYKNLNPEWNITRLQHNLYEEIGGLLSEDEEVNILTVSKRLKDTGRLRDGDLAAISGMTASVGPSDLMTPYTIFNLVDIEHKERRAKILVNQIHSEINNGTWNVEKFRGDLTNHLESLKDEVVKTETNVETVFKVIDQHNLAKKGELPGTPLPYHTFNKKVLIEDVDLMVIGARPAMGKTAFVVSSAVKYAFQEEKRVAIFALEMSRTQMLRRIIANLAQVDSNRIKYGECNDYEMKKIYNYQAMDELENIMIYEGSKTIEDIAAEVTRMKSGNGVDIVLVDYLQKIQPTNKRDDLTVSVTKASNGLKKISQNMHVPIIAMAQLSRESSKTGKRPSLPDLRQSGEIEQDASIVGFIHRPEYYGEDFMEDGFTPSDSLAEIIIAKNREGEIGIYNMRVNLKISKFMDLAAFDSSAEPGVQTTMDEDNPF
jgi:replicative DNA helicase